MARITSAFLARSSKKGFGTQIVGLKELQVKLTRLEKVSSRKAVRAGVNAGLNPIVQAIRSTINTTPATAEAKLAARQTVGKRIATTKGVITTAKAGFGTGTKSQRQRTRDRSTVRRVQLGRKSTGGVGTSSRNIHWLVLGTRKRFQYTTGRKTGSERAIFLDVVPRAVAISKIASLNAARRKIWQVTKREALRKG